MAPRVESLTISCTTCRLEHTPACSDCVVSFLLDHDPADALIIDASELQAVRLLERGGLVPALRHERRAG